MNEVIDILRYQLADGKVPVSSWLANLRDQRARVQIEIRIKRIATGNLGDCKPVGDGVLELRIDVGAGYRLYCGQHGHLLVILLHGGDKATQAADIKRAKEYWSDWKRKNR
jgi:putative addiction module killer protein